MMGVQMMQCPRCKQNVSGLIETPPSSLIPKVCKPCAKFLWKIYDNNQGLNEDISRSEAREIVGAEKKPRHKPTERHAIIAEIAKELGADVTEQDVKIIFAATRVEYEERTGKVAAGGKARAMA